MIYFGRDALPNPGGDIDDENILSDQQQRTLKCPGFDGADAIENSVPGAATDLVEFLPVQFASFQPPGSRVDQVILGLMAAWDGFQEWHIDDFQ